MPYCDWCKEPRTEIELEEVVIKPGRAVKDKDGHLEGWKGRKTIKVCRVCIHIVKRQLSMGPDWEKYLDENGVK